MTFTFAVTGKGGVGKTTFAALAIRHIHEATKEVVLAVDADPNANLGAKLGTEPAKTLGGIREDMLARGEDEPPAGVSKQEHLDYQIRLAVKEGTGFDLLTMGRQEGPGCYCYVNNMLRNIVDSLSDRYKYVVIDNEADMEHLSRRTTKASDAMFVLCDRSRGSLAAAQRISQLADEMKIQISRKALVFNGLDPGAEGPPSQAVERFHAVYGVRRSGRILSSAEETESLMGIPRTDPAFTDIARAVDAERLRR